MSTAAKVGVGLAVSVALASAAYWYYIYVYTTAAGTPVPAEGGDSGIADTIEQAQVTVENAVGVAWPYPRGSQYKKLFDDASAEYGIPPNLLAAQGWQESRFRDDIISGATVSKAGAVGIMQIVPKWHPDLGAEGAADPTQAVPYAAQYLASLYTQFGTWPLALAAYNWGPGNLRGSPDPSTWPTETQNYVQNITNGAGVSLA